MTHRWLKFWPQDWQRDPAVRMCGLAARGLWMELLCVAHDGEPYGHVTVNSRAPTTKQISMLVGVSEAEVARLIHELEDAGVFDRTAEGVIVSRRMVRDGTKSEEGRSHARARWPNGDGRGGPNGSPKRSTEAPPIRGPAGYDCGSPYRDPNSLEAEFKKQNSRSRIQERKKKLATLAPSADADFERFWSAYPRKVGKGEARKAFDKAIRKTTIDALLGAIGRQQWPADPRFIKHPSGWLNGERWLDAQEPFDPVLRAVGLTEDDFAEPPAPTGLLQ